MKIEITNQEELNLFLFTTISNLKKDNLFFHNFLKKVLNADESEYLPSNDINLNKIFTFNYQNKQITIDVKNRKKIEIDLKVLKLYLTSPFISDNYKLDITKYLIENEHKDDFIPFLSKTIPHFGDKENYQIYNDNFEETIQENKFKQIKVIKDFLSNYTGLDNPYETEIVSFFYEVRNIINKTQYLSDQDEAENLENLEKLSKLSYVIAMFIIEDKFIQLLKKNEYLWDILYDISLTESKYLFKTQLKVNNFKNVLLETSNNKDPQKVSNLLDEIILETEVKFEIVNETNMGKINFETTLIRTERILLDISNEFLTSFICSEHPELNGNLMLNFLFNHRETIMKNPNEIKTVLKKIKDNDDLFSKLPILDFYFSKNNFNYKGYLLLKNITKQLKEKTSSSISKKEKVAYFQHIKYILSNPYLVKYLYENKKDRFLNTIKKDLQIILKERSEIMTVVMHYFYFKPNDLDFNLIQDILNEEDKAKYFNLIYDIEDLQYSRNISQGIIDLNMDIKDDRNILNSIKEIISIKELKKIITKKIDINELPQIDLNI